MAIKIKFISEIEVKDGKKVLKAAKNANIKIDKSCGEKGKCGKCLIKVISGKLTEPTKHELKVLGQEKIDKGYRLSCQAQILEESVIQIINDSDTMYKDKTNDNKKKTKEEIMENKTEINDNDKIKVSEENKASKIEIKKTSKAETKNESIGNKI
jgi:ferredoxin